MDRLPFRLVGWSHAWIGKECRSSFVTLFWNFLILINRFKSKSWKLWRVLLAGHHASNALLFPRRCVAARAIAERTSAPYHLMDRPAVAKLALDGASGGDPLQRFMSNRRVWFSQGLVPASAPEYRQYVASCYP